jgi:hypothetical protein
LGLSRKSVWSSLLVLLVGPSPPFGRFSCKTALRRGGRYRVREATSYAASVWLAFAFQGPKRNSISASSGSVNVRLCWHISGGASLAA